MTSMKLTLPHPASPCLTLPHPASPCLTLPNPALGTCSDLTAQLRKVFNELDRNMDGLLSPTELNCMLDER